MRRGAATKDLMSELVPASPKVTAIFLLYNAERAVPVLVDAICLQTHPNFPAQSDWLEVIFVDDQSRDTTLTVLKQTLDRIGNSPNFRIITNPQNLGLARTLNMAFSLARAPFALTCHCDCVFGSETYLADMLALMERHPSAAAIAGHPTLARGKLPFAEKLNLISNLMPVLPEETDAELVPVGFVEGRCDLFRVEALRAVGFYDTALRVAGEDQVLAGKLREKGYATYRATRLAYILGASDEQDSLRKLARHLFRFGKVHPFIVFRQRKTIEGLLGPSAGWNFQSRTLLRVWQIISTACYAASLASILGGAPTAVWMLPLVLALGGKLAFFYLHLRHIPMSAEELLKLFAAQPVLDVAYTAGVIRGFWLLGRGTPENPIT
jgi:GT2 family glycosyltransferase